MEQKWKKRYSFRLKQGDQELYEWLEDIPDSKRSEAIRNLLLFACRTISNEKQQIHQAEHIVAELEAMRKMNEQHHQELLHRLASVQADSAEKTNSAGKQHKSEQVTGKAMTDSATAMMSSFGITM